jgi:putative hydroxymethylpyrimidine transport system substrate-binding protein
VLGLVGALAAAGCGSSDDESSSTSAASSDGGTSTAAAPETRDVKFMLEWAANASQIWAISGKERGFFARNGIDPEFQFPDDSATPIKALQAGRTDFGLQLSIGPAIAKGEGADIKVIGTLELLDVGLMVQSDEISDFQQLKGKTVGVGSSTYNEVCFERTLETQGMTTDDVKIVDPGFNLVPPLLAGKFAGVNGSHYEAAIALAKQPDKPIRILSFAPDSCPYDPIQILTTDKMIREHPETVRAFMRGIADSLAWSMDNTREAAAIWAERYPDLDPRSDLAQWQASAPTFCGPESETKGLLYSDPDQYRQLIQLAADARAIDAPYPVEELMTNDFLPDPPVTQPCANDRYRDVPLEQVTG